MGPVASVAKGAFGMVKAGAAQALFGGGGQPQQMEMDPNMLAMMIIKQFGPQMMMGQFRAANVEDAQKMELFINTVGFENAKVVLRSDAVVKELGIEDPEFPDLEDDLPNYYEALTPEQGKQLVELLEQRREDLEIE